MSLDVLIMLTIFLIVVVVNVADFRSKRNGEWFTTNGLSKARYVDKKLEYRNLTDVELDAYLADSAW